ncbi:MAG: cysteine synthase [Bryobacteraceae bacterium]
MSHLTLSAVDEAAPLPSLLARVGNTPLLRLDKVTREFPAIEFYAKAEWFNPGGSVKDRAALNMILEGERSGQLSPDKIILDATSGNTGIAYAMIAAARGYRVKLCLPASASIERTRILRAFGAELVLTDPAEGSDGAIRKVRELYASDPERYFYPDQYNNPANWRAHYQTTANEIWEQTGGRITHFVAAAGTGGTITGAGRYLKEKNPAIRVISGDPVGSIFAEYYRTGVKGESTPYKVEGIGNDKLPTTMAFDIVDEFYTLTDREAFHMARRLTREEGLFVGGSSGLITELAVRVAKDLDDPDALIVCILPDTGERYLSKVYNEEWLREHRLLEPERLTAGDMVERKGGPAPPLVFVEPTAPTRQALALITEHDISQLPVCTDQRCVGSLSEATLMARVIEDPAILDRPVAALMDAPFPDVEAYVPMTGVGRMLTRQTPAVLVRREGRLAGIITRYDVVRYLTR